MQAVDHLGERAVERRQGEVVERVRRAEHVVAGLEVVVVGVGAGEVWRRVARRAAGADAPGDAVMGVAGAAGIAGRRASARLVAAGWRLPAPMMETLSKSKAGDDMNCRARVRKLSTPVQPVSRRNNLLTIGARCSVLSPDCIHNVDNSQVPPSLHRSPKAGSQAAPANPWHGQSQGDGVIRIGPSGWRLAPRPQRPLIRRTTAATSSSGSPTGQTAEAATRSGASPSTSEDASPNRA